MERFDTIRQFHQKPNDAPFILISYYERRALVRGPDLKHLLLNPLVFHVMFHITSLELQYAYVFLVNSARCPETLEKPSLDIAPTARQQHCSSSVNINL